jgi:hypothetical protein
MRHMAFRIDEADRERLEKTSEALGISVSELVRRAIGSFADVSSGAFEGLNVLQERMMLPERLVLSTVICDAVARSIAHDHAFGEVPIQPKDVRTNLSPEFQLIDRLVRFHVAEGFRFRRDRLLRNIGSGSLTGAEEEHLQLMDSWLRKVDGSAIEFMVQENGLPLPPDRICALIWSSIQSKQRVRELGGTAEE